MIIKLISLAIILSITYVLGVFFVPEISDKYGNAHINAKIREYKTLSLEFASGSKDPMSLFEKITNSSQTYIDETKKTYENVQNTVSEKVQDVKNAADSVENAYKAINEAKTNIQKAVQISSGGTNP